LAGKKPLPAQDIVPGGFLPAGPAVPGARFGGKRLSGRLIFHL